MQTSPSTCSLLRRIALSGFVLFTPVWLSSCAPPDAPPLELSSVDGPGRSAIKAPTPPPQLPDYKDKKKPKISTGRLEQRIHDLINEEREQQGLEPLEWDGRLAEIARQHSLDMAQRTYFSHVSPEGRDFPYRYQQNGYTCSVRVKDILYTGAENIFQNNLYNRSATVNGVAYYDWNSEKELAASTVRGWMNSPGHRRNILTPHWQNQGIGIAISPDGKVYITQNFC